MVNLTFAIFLSHRILITDTKVTNLGMMRKMQSFAINGPTTSHGIPPFVWTAAFNSTAHFGQPDIFNFDFVFMDPQWK